MQRCLSELHTQPEPELLRLVERDPLLVTRNGEPYIAQSLESFEAMVRRIRELEGNPLPQAPEPNIIRFRRVRRP